MKKNNLLKTVLLFVFTFLFLQGCRNENVFENSKQDLTKKIKISVIKNNNIIKNTKVFEEITKIQNEKLNKKSYGKTIQDSVLEGATILTENVMLAEEGEKKTYTFQLKRSFKTSKIENLVLKKNIDSTYSGILIQYDITPEEKELFVNGHDVDLKNKIKIYDINKIKLSSRTVVDVIGCYEITWELGWCSSGQHMSGQDSDCTVGGAPKPVIVAITFTCGDNGGGGSTGNDSGTNDPSFPSDGNSSSGGISDYNTTPYIGTFEEYQAYLLELNRVFRLKLNSSQLSWYDANTSLSIELAKLYNQDTSLENLNFLKSLIEYMKNSTNSQDTLLYINILDLLHTDTSHSQNWSLINSILTNNNPETGIFILNFLKENPDTLNKTEIVNRLKALDDLFKANPNVLLDIPCSQLPYWQELANHQIPQQVKDKLKTVNTNSHWYNSDLEIQNLDYSKSYTINMDVYPVKITNLPNKPGTNQKYTPSEFFNYFRLNINKFTDASHGQFFPVVDSNIGINDTALWNSTNPLSSLITIKIPLDEGTVICSGYNSQAWIFTTVKSPWDGEHPVSGNRLFGYYMDGNDMYIYTRGIDRFTSTYSTPEVIRELENIGYSKASDMWKNMQNLLNNFVINNNGSSQVLPGVDYIPNYIFVKEYLKGQRSISTLGCH